MLIETFTFHDRFTRYAPQPVTFGEELSRKTKTMVNEKDENLGIRDDSHWLRAIQNLAKIMPKRMGPNPKPPLWLILSLGLGLIGLAYIWVQVN